MPKSALSRTHEVLQTMSIKEKLNQARKEILDLSLRNSLLNFRMPKARGAQIINESSNHLFRLFVTDEKSLYFRSLDKDLFSDTDGNLKPSNEKHELLEAAHSDSYLQTPYDEKSLQKRLLTTYLFARTHIEERGVNILFLALGMVHWFEDDNSDKELIAPALLIPVELVRTDVQDKFKIKYNGEEIDENLSLAARLKDYSIDLPTLPEDEDIDISKYLSLVKHSIRGQSRWKVDENEICLGFFSFNKFLMYKDLDPSYWIGDTGDIDHPIASALIQNGFKETDTIYIDEDRLDSLVAPGDLRSVINADSSQTIAILEVKNGKNMVIQGPPGTGKSQTITNIIAEALGEGKKVLFVAEKMAALEVVKRRLDTLHLGDACLELHSHNANKKQVINDLNRTFNLTRPIYEDKTTDVEILRHIRDELNAYAEAVNTNISTSGYTPFQIVGELTRLKRIFKEISFPTSFLNGASIDLPLLSKTDLRKKETLIGNFEGHLKKMGVPSEHPFKHCKLTFASPAEESRIQLSSTDMHKAVLELLHVLNSLAEQAGLPGVTTIKESAQIICTAKRLIEKPNLSGINAETGLWIEKRDDNNKLLSSGQRLKVIHEELGPFLLPQGWDEDMTTTRKVLLGHKEKWWRLLSKDYRQAKRHFQKVHLKPIPKDPKALLRIADALIEAKQHKDFIALNRVLAASLYGSQWQGKESDWGRLSTISKWIYTVHQDISEGKLFCEILACLQGNKDFSPLSKLIKEAEQRHAQFSSAFVRFTALLNYDQGIPTDDLPLHAFAGTLNGMLKRTRELQDQITFNKFIKMFIDEGLTWLLEIGRTWEHGKDHMTNLFRFAYFDSLIKVAYNEKTALRDFNGDVHEHKISDFRKFDEEILKYSRILLAYAHWKNLPKSDSAHGQLSILLREFAKRTRLFPIRKLIKQAGNAIQAIKPVFMMSPLSIASFLPPGNISFDLVIFDEASQVKPVDAFNAILRGKQLVVVGDSKQLPPTSFFDELSYGDDEDVDEDTDQSATQNIESILQLMKSQGAPERMLQWHYRSRHESLIAVSNHEFYDHKLKIFPSPVPDRKTHKTGLIFHLLPDTVYDRGKTRTNKLEAKAVAKAVMHHAATCPNLTLGVAAFSIAQMQAIIDELEILRNKEPSCENFFSMHPAEPFFVKNLETVQGDERDVIFISIGYGKTSEGYVALTFAALNRDGGERRLNVLITRAKHRCEVFSNITHADIDLSRTKSVGVATLKTFLKFAETGILDVPSPTGKDADSVFEEEVAEAIMRQGHQVEMQVGSAGFYIDLAVVDPDKPGSYLLGIECDGATYHRSKSARDRDRLRQIVLENLGWTIHRIWSSDWFHNPDREADKVDKAIEEAKFRNSAGRSPAECPPSSAINLHPLMREEGDGNAGRMMQAKHYSSASLSINLKGQELHEVPQATLAKYLYEIAEVESPVHIHEAFRRVADAAGITRIGNRIETSLNNALQYAKRMGKLKIDKHFLWSLHMAIPSVRDRSALPQVSKKIEYICEEEITQAILIIVRESFGINRNDIPVAACRLLGYARTTDDMRHQVDRIVNLLIQKNKLTESNNLVSIS